MDESSWNLTALTEAFFLGAFPWVSQLKRLDIHFTSPVVKPASIFNFFASLFAVSIYAYTVYAHPTQVIAIPRWTWFLLAAAVLAGLYVTLVIYTRKEVAAGGKTWPLLAGFGMYVGLFLTLTAGFGQLRVMGDYILLEGRVVDTDNERALRGADIEIRGAAPFRRSARTDRGGKFALLIDRDRYGDLSQAIISLPGYEEVQVTFADGFSASASVKHIQLTRSGGGE